jgi:holliday junction DNA helicase RuvB
MPELATDTLRPSSLAEFVGQTKLREILSIAIAGANSRHEPMGHTMFIGPPGLGKTTLAKILANETHRNLVIANGPSITKIQYVHTLLEAIRETPSVLFIDEIHRMPRAVEESLYPVMEDYKFRMTGKQIDIELTLAPFTLVGATTRLGMMTKPLRDRFVHTHSLDWYTDAELFQVISRSARISRIDIEPAAIEAIAKRSRKTPRIANNLLLRSRDFALAHKITQVSWPVVLGMFQLLEIDEYGLDRIDREILDTLISRFDGRPAGIDTIAASMGEELDVIEQIHEPFLLQAGFIARTKSGRVALPPAYRLLGKLRGTTKTNRGCAPDEPDEMDGTEEIN